MQKSALGCFLLTLGLAGCAHTPPPTAAPPEGESTARCDAGKVSDVVGQSPTPATRERARIAAGAQVARVLQHDQVVTLEYRVGRLNLVLDAAGRIASANCG